MKKLIIPILMALLFLACQKSEKVAPKTTSPKDTVITVKYDTISDFATINVSMTDADSSNFAGFQFMFNHTFHLTATDSYDSGPPMEGFNGPPSAILYALSSDGRDLVEDAVPYTRGMITNLDATSIKGGAYLIKAGQLFYIPADIQIWIKDNYLKDSLDLRLGNYHFNIDNSNPSTYGKQRFQIILKQ